MDRRAFLGFLSASAIPPAFGGSLLFIAPNRLNAEAKTVVTAISVVIKMVELLKGQSGDGRRFEVMQRSLDTIIYLQKQTLEAIADVENAIRESTREILDEIRNQEMRDRLLASTRLSQAVEYFLEGARNKESVEVINDLIPILKDNARNSNDMLASLQFTKVGSENLVAYVRDALIVCTQALEVHQVCRSLVSLHRESEGVSDRNFSDLKSSYFESMHFLAESMRLLSKDHVPVIFELIAQRRAETNKVFQEEPFSSWRRLLLKDVPERHDGEPLEFQKVEYFRYYVTAGLCRNRKGYSFSDLNEMRERWGISCGTEENPSIPVPNFPITTYLHKVKFAVNFNVTYNKGSLAGISRILFTRDRMDLRQSEVLHSGLICSTGVPLGSDFDDFKMSPLDHSFICPGNKDTDPFVYAWGEAEAAERALGEKLDEFATAITADCEDTWLLAMFDQALTFLRENIHELEEERSRWDGIRSIQEI